MLYQIQEKTESGYWKVVFVGDEKDVVSFVNSSSSDAFSRMENIDECMDWFYIEKDQYRLLKVGKEKQTDKGL